MMYNRFDIPTLDSLAFKPQNVSYFGAEEMSIFTLLKLDYDFYFMKSS